MFGIADSDLLLYITGSVSSIFLFILLEKGLRLTRKGATLILFVIGMSSFLYSTYLHGMPPHPMGSFTGFFLVPVIFSYNVLSVQWAMKPVKNK